MSQQRISVEWKERLGALKFLLDGKDACDVKSDLAQGIVTDDTLDKTEKILAEIDSFLVEISVKCDAERETLKELSRLFEHYRRQMTNLEFNVLDDISGHPFTRRKSRKIQEKNNPNYNNNIQFLQNND